MKRFVHFFSLAILTQVVLMLSQLILLPIQVRVWGQAATANWYSALALAAMTFVVDCGLRTAGHSELLRATQMPGTHKEEAEFFRQVWGWIRLLVVAVTALLIVCDFTIGKFEPYANYAGWRAVLIIACALETVLVIRIGYLDSLGRYRGGEASYFTFALLRLGLSVPALYYFHVNAQGLAAIYLLTSVTGLLLQGCFLCRSTPLLQLTQRFPKPSLKILFLARHTVAEPLANWARLSLPVLVIANISQPIAVTTYVALRAAFGGGRTTIQQLARVASVECLKLRSEGRPAQAQTMLTFFVMAAALFGACAGSALIVDNMRLIGLWLKHFNRELFQQITLAFALTAPFFSYQIPMNLMFRNGELASVARRHYAFVGYSILFAGTALIGKSLALYLGLLVTSEILLSVSFYGPVQRALRVAVGGSVITFLLWMLVHFDFVHSFSSFTAGAMVRSAIVVMVIFGAASIFLYRDFRPRFLRPSMAVAK